LKNPLILGCAAVTAVALAAGCGSSGKSTSSATTAAAPAATTSAAATTPASGKSADGAAAASSTASSGSGVVIAVKHSKLGTVLAAGPKHTTVYLFEADKGGQSACTGACAQAWPPVTTGSQPTSSGSASSAKLGTITRADGTKQVTYNGHPLYFFVKDGDAEDAYGQGQKAFGADWYVVAPNGNKIDSDEHSGGGGSAS
jgi:predicted lipoprotein with Yx(FWY)xxD motif